MILFVIRAITELCFVVGVCAFVNVGTLPDGVYNRNTKIFFCCRSDGPADLPIILPTAVPFYLLKFDDRCQKVGTGQSEQLTSKL